MRNRPNIVDHPDDPRHGTLNGYGNCGCHCLRCKRANAESQYRYNHSDDGTRLEIKARKAREKRALLKEGGLDD